LSFTRTLAAALCCFAALAAGCGDTSDDGRLSSGEIPTATLPAELPEATIVGGGVVQPGGGSTYTVKSGDTLAGIAERFGISLEDLLAANPGINPSRLQSGDNVKLPTGTEPPPPDPTATEGPAETPVPEATREPVEEPTVEPTEAPAETATPSPGGQTYTVQEGDIPGTIAAQFGITVEELLAANPGIDPTNLQIGQVLNIPPPAPEGG
jgi:LysM repeat protein